MGTNYYLVKTKPTVEEPLHIGKSSGGWRFLFYDTEYYFDDEYVPLHTYNQWYHFIDDRVKNGTHVLINEYDETITVEKFDEMVRAKQEIDNQDNFSNARNIDGYRFSEDDFC